MESNLSVLSLWCKFDMSWFTLALCSSVDNIHCRPQAGTLTQSLARVRGREEGGKWRSWPRPRTRAISASSPAWYPGCRGINGKHCGNDFIRQGINIRWAICWAIQFQHLSIKVKRTAIFFLWDHYFCEQNIWLLQSISVWILFIVLVFRRDLYKF